MTTKSQTNQPSADDFQAQLVAAQQAQATAEEAHKRALADYQNLQYRSTQERLHLRKLACQDLLTDLLPTLDHLELALQHFTDPSLKMVASELDSVLKKHGLVRIKTEGLIFDPQLMEAVDTTSGEKDRVIREQRAGYRLDDVVIRHAAVVVGTGEPQNS